MGKSQIRRSNQKVQLKNYGLQKEIESNEATKLKLRKKQDPFINLNKSQILKYQNLVQVG